MIGVVNISDEYSRVGVQHYEVRLNEIVLATFTHNGEDGMATCLRKASESLVGIDIDQKIQAHRKAYTERILKAIYQNVGH